MKDILVGVNYFAGWWDRFPSKWYRQDGRGGDWRPDFPERVALLGQYNDQETMDREIVMAASHGVDFFPILWYYNDPGSEREPCSRFLERGLKNFIASPEAHRMQFFIEFCNHPPYEVKTEGQWADCLREWLIALRHPSYMRVDGRLVFKVHGGKYFYIQNGRDEAACRLQLNRLREAVREAGLGEMLIGCGIVHEPRDPVDEVLERLFDFTCTYMDVPPLEKTDEDYPYEMLADFAHRDRLERERGAIAHMPYLPAGWCPRPWPDPRATFALPKAGQWEAALRQMADDLRASRNLGLPLAGGGRQKMFTIYAWNEFGEGGIVAPTYVTGLMKLQAIGRVFGGE